MAVPSSPTALQTFCQALKGGDVDTLRATAPHLQRAWFPPDHEALNEAARRGHLEALKCLDRLPQVGVNWAEVVHEAARGGHLELTQWLIPRSLATALQGALAIAAQKGHMEVVTALAPHVPAEWATSTLTNHWPARPKLLSALGSRVIWGNQLQRFLLDCITAGDASVVHALLDAFPGQKIWLDGAGTAMRSPLDDDTIVDVVRRCSTDPDSPFAHEPLVNALSAGVSQPHRLALIRRLCRELPAGQWPAEDMAEVWMQAVDLDAPDATVRELAQHASAAAVGEQWLARAPRADLPFNAFERFAPWVSAADVQAWWTTLETAVRASSIDTWKDQVPSLARRMEALHRHAQGSDRAPKRQRPRVRA